ncbi:hypothetical protein BPOR_0684g00020 [Botrytis porri]|uniref:Major facilitator superfamily (MFS) profile domain-containing protein n=1 Tax=Botrytis porri TaxID=87229 RepID=A0A4Z1KCY2_9HELO|nr:hypothetical protein BPOR_0684g00020 [Botrytis porri]
MDAQEIYHGPFKTTGDEEVAAINRGNIENALTSTVTTDLGVTTNQINITKVLLDRDMVLRGGHGYYHSRCDVLTCSRKIVEGLITIGIGCIFILFLPPSVANGSPLISAGKWSYFTPREQYILVRRILLDDPAKTTRHLRITGREVLKTIRKPRVLVHNLITLTSTISVSAVQGYGPSIIKSLGFKTVRANAMASVGNHIAAFVVVILGCVADKTGRRGPAVVFGAAWCVIAYACLRISIGESKWHRYAAVFIPNVSWLSINCKSPKERSIAMAMIIMAANLAAIAGSQVFRTADAPLYTHAFTAMYILAAATFVIVVGLMGWYVFANRRLGKKPEVVQGGLKMEGESGEEGSLEVVMRCWWTW